MIIMIIKRTKKTMEREGDGDTNKYWCAQNNPQILGKETGRLGK